MCRASKAQTKLAATGEAKALLREMTDAFKRQLDFFERCSKLSPDEAFTKATNVNEVYEEHLRHGPPEKLTFFDLCALARLDPEAATQRWSEIKQSAHGELRSGQRAAQAMEFQRHPWGRAQFLALRKEMAEAWWPRNGIETLLIDQMAMALTGVFTWQETLTRRSWAEFECEKAQADRDGTWSPPRITSAEAIEQAMTMVDRFKRMLLRTLRALRDLRRYEPAIVVRNAGQVNIGKQQVNVAGRRRR